MSIDADGTLGAPVPAGFDFSGYRPIPGVLHAYKASAADVGNHVRPRLQGALSKRDVVPGPRETLGTLRNVMGAARVAARTASMARAGV